MLLRILYYLSRYKNKLIILDLIIIHKGSTILYLRDLNCIKSEMQEVLEFFLIKESNWTIKMVIIPFI